MVQEEVLLVVTLGVYLNKTVVIAFEELLYRRATRHVLIQVAKCIDVDGHIFENVLF
jgi:hypothetical protein